MKNYYCELDVNETKGKQNFKAEMRLMLEDIFELMDKDGEAYKDSSVLLLCPNSYWKNIAENNEHWSDIKNKG